MIVGQLNGCRRFLGRKECGQHEEEGKGQINDVGFLSVCNECVLFPLVIEEAVSANGFARIKAGEQPELRYIETIGGERNNVAAEGKR